MSANDKDTPCFVVAGASLTEYYEPDPIGSSGIRALLPDLPPLYSVELRCPECDTLGQSHGDQTSPRELVCPECLHEWTSERLRTAEELIAHLRNLLVDDQDASGRRWYNAQRTLFAVAEALEAFPELVQL